MKLSSLFNWLTVFLFLFCFSFSPSSIALDPEDEPPMTDDDHLRALDMARWTTKHQPDRKIVRTVTAIEGAGGLRELFENQVVGDNADVTIVLAGRYNPYVLDAIKGPIKIGWITPPRVGLAAPYRCSRITIRGEISDWKSPNFVKIDGGLCTQVFILENSSDITFADLKIYRARQNAVKIVGESDPNNNTYRFHHCVIADCSQSLIYVTRDNINVANINKVARGGLIEYCFIGWTGQTNVPNNLPFANWITNSTFGDDGHATGVNIEGGVNWIMRHNIFYWCTPTQKPAVVDDRTTRNFGILATKKAVNIVAEFNRFFMCESAISFGNQNAADNLSFVPDLTIRNNFYDIEGGRIANNMIYRRTKIIYRPPPPAGPYCSAHWPGWVDNCPQIIVKDAANISVVNNSVHVWPNLESESLPTINGYRLISFQGADTKEATFMNNITTDSWEIDKSSQGLPTGNWTPNFEKGITAVYSFIPPTGPGGICILPHPWGFCFGSLIAGPVSPTFDPSDDTLSFRNYSTQPPWPLDMHLWGSYNSLVPAAPQLLVDTFSGIINHCNRHPDANMDYDTAIREAAQGMSDYGADEWGLNKPPIPIAGADAGNNGGKPKLKFKPLPGKASDRPTRMLSQEEYNQELAKLRELQKKNTPSGASDRSSSGPAISNHNEAANNAKEARESNNGESSNRSIPNTNPSNSNTPKPTPGVGLGN